MHMDKMMPQLVLGALVVLILGIGMRRLRQPAVIGYLIAGVLLGPSLLGFFNNFEMVSRLGSFGVILLLFYVGMEISLPHLMAKWRIAVLGTLFQIIASVGCSWLIGFWFDWPVGRIVLIGFVISLSSTAVVLKVLQEQNALATDIGRNVTGILIVQDLMIIPMLIVVGVFGGEGLNAQTVSLQVVGGLLFLALLAWLSRKQDFQLPFGRWFAEDSEMEVFAGFLICFGAAFITGLMGLSTALGAFVAGILVTAARETHWVHARLEPFRVVFLGLFFLSVGMLVDLSFALENWKVILLVILATFATNTLINAVILRVLGVSWRRSLYSGALLSQIGEFSFVLAAVGFERGMISRSGYQLILVSIAFTLLLSPIWFQAARRLFLANEKLEPDGSGQASAP